MDRHPEGTFIISLDCEGKWGMADHLTGWHHRHLNKPELIKAYRSLVDLFAQYDISATFAFVMAFVLSEADQADMSDWFVDTPINGMNWLSAYRAARSASELSGWSCPEALDIVRENQRHEIACHGFTHVPLSEDLVAKDVMIRELAACAEVARNKGLGNLHSFVFPRNLVGYEDALRAAGYSGFRCRPKTRPKALALLAEMNPFDRAQFERPVDEGMVAIPSGEMVNWQRGPRRFIPRAVSRRRWSSRLEDAANSGGVAHIWLHPHNIIDSPGTIERLDDVLAEATRLRDAGKLVVMTQAQYCARQRS